MLLYFGGVWATWLAYSFVFLTFSVQIVLRARQISLRLCNVYVFLSLSFLDDSFIGPNVLVDFRQKALLEISGLLNSFDPIWIMSETNRGLICIFMEIFYFIFVFPNRNFSGFVYIFVVWGFYVRQ